jgi:hypothetical protein
MADFPPQNIANLLGAFPKLGCTPPVSFWDKALPAVQRALPAFKPQVRMHTLLVSYIYLS